MITSEVFPTTRHAVDWVMKNYFDIDPKFISYRMMPGVGTRVIIKEPSDELRIR